jgi:hypothetical protein
VEAMKTFFSPPLTKQKSWEQRKGKEKDSDDKM